MDEDAKCLDEHLLWSWEKNVRSGDIHAANKPGCREHRIGTWEKEKGEQTGTRGFTRPRLKSSRGGRYVENGRPKPSLREGMLPLFAEARAAIGS